jgi:hypothetical protein
MARSVNIKIAGTFDDSDIGQIEVYSRADVAMMRQRTFARCHLSIVAEGELFVVVQLFGDAAVDFVELEVDDDRAGEWVVDMLRDGSSACWAPRAVDDPFWPARHAMHLEEVA